MRTLLSVVSVLLCFLPFTANSQCLADFTIPTSVCINERFDIANNSVGINYAWDFCAGDLESTPTLDTNPIPSTSFNHPSFITMVNDGGNWYGFVVSRFGRNITRLDFGPDPTSTPISVNLGNFGNTFLQPADMEFFKENNIWYAVLIDAVGNKLWRFTFNAIDNTTPALQSLDGFNSLNLLNGPIDIELLYETGNIVAVIANYNGSKITQANFGNSITNQPSGVDINIPSSNTFQGVAALKICDTWNVLSTSTATHKIFSLKYSGGLNNAPTVAEVIPTGVSISQPVGVDLVDDNNVFYSFVQSANGDMFKLTNAESVNPTGTLLGNFSGNGGEGLSLVKSGTNWAAFTVNGNENGIKRLKFPTTCSSNSAISSSQNPADISYSQSGTYQISVNVSDNSGNVKSLSKAITVLAAVAPVVSLTSESAWCLSSASNFLANVNDPASISSYSWNWGDGNTGSGQNTNYQYSVAGTYNVKLWVLATNGCSNQAKSVIHIYNPPASSFTLPSDNPLCTNQNLVFNNTSSFDNGSNPSWQWSINGVPSSTEKNPVFAFADVSNKTIKLDATIPGCGSSSTQAITTLKLGPVVAFSFSGICQSDPTLFSNQTTGSVQTYAWDFGDGNTSSIATTQNTFADIGDYSVKLTATNAIGCNNTAIKTVSIRSKPAPNFSLDLPPFSCNGSPSQFNDTTPGLPDSNILSWNWAFGDTQNGVSSLQNPTYVFANAGQYSVSLKATTDFGCNATVQKQVTIQQSPQVAFTNSSACLGQAASFTDASTGSIKSRLWRIGTSTYTNATTSHTFTGSGSFTAQLTVTGNNNCITTLTKTITVPVPPVLDFSIQNNCSGQNAIFTDVTSAGADPIASRVWDFANQGTASGSPTQHVFSNTGVYAVKMTATSQSGCAYPLTKNVSITRTPTAGFTSSVQSGPAPLNVQFSNTSLNASSYLWQFNDTDGSTSTLTSPSFTFTTLGDFLVKVTAISAQGCRDTFSSDIKIILPIPDLAIDNVNLVRNETTGTIKLSVALRNKGNSIISGSSLLVDVSGFSLLKENVATSIMPGQSLVYLTNTELVMRADEIKYICAEVKAADDRDASNNKECILVEENLVYFAPYPNPSQGLLHLDWVASQSAEAIVEIVNSVGQKVYHKKITATRAGLNQLEFDITALNAGVYILVFEIEGMKKSFRFQVSK